MNKNIKFHTPTGPAFNPGEVWVSSTGHEVEIVSIVKYPGSTSDHTSDFEVTFKSAANTQVKDAWNFQVRYTHKADTYAKI
jgi:hypothetical protein